MKYHFKLHKEEKGYWAQCIELQGCITQGDTLKEVGENMKEALDLYLEEPKTSRDVASLPDEKIKKTKTIQEVPVNPQIAFALLVRHSRIKQGLTQRQAAKKLGFDNLYSYQRLETKKCNPSLKTLSKVKHFFSEISIDQVIGL